MKTYRVGVVGCGGIAQVHGAGLQDLKGVELAACADIRRERAEDFAQKYGGKRTGLNQIGEERKIRHAAKRTGGNSS